MKPMDLTSTPFLSYCDIRTENVDLIEDAYGLAADFHDVIDFLATLKSVPGKNLTKSVINMVRKKV
jgi:hypothetical protein